MNVLRRLFLGEDGALRAGWRCGLFLLANALAVAFLEPLFWRLSLSVATWLWLSLAATLVVTTAFLAAESRPLRSIGLALEFRWGWHFLSGLAGGVLLMLAVALVCWSLDGCHWVRGSGNLWASVGSGAWLFLAVAFREEVLFRGYAFQRLVEATGPRVALALAALYFAYAHWDNPGMAGATKAWATVNIALAGVLLGLCYLKTRSLALPIGVHLGWNWAQGSLLGFGVSGMDLGGVLRPVLHDRPLWLTGGAFGLEASLPCAVLCGLAIAGLVVWKPTGSRNADENAR